MRNPSPLRQVTGLTDKSLTSWLVSPGVVRGCTVTKGVGLGLNVEPGSCFTANGVIVPIPYRLDNVVQAIPATIKDKIDYVVVIAENGGSVFRYISGELFQNVPASPLSFENGIMLAKVVVKYPTNSLADVFIYNTVPSVGEQIVYDCRPLAVADGTRTSFIFPVGMVVDHSLDLRIGGVPQREITDYHIFSVEGPDKQPYILVVTDEAVPEGVDVIADIYCGKTRLLT